MSQRKRPRRRAKPLAELVTNCPSAAAVWIALSDLAADRGSSVVTPTRAQLRTLTGLTLKTISRALTSLETAGWLDRVHVLRENSGALVTLLRIVLRRKRTTPTATATAATTSRSSSGSNRNGLSTPAMTTRRSGPTAPATEINVGDDCTRYKTTSTKLGFRTLGKITHHRYRYSGPATEGNAVAGVDGPKGRGRKTPSDSSFGREGGAPPGPPPSLTLGFGPRTPPQEQRLGEELEDDYFNADFDCEHPPSTEISAELQSILDSIGADADPPGDPAEPEAS